MISNRMSWRKKCFESEKLFNFSLCLCVLLFTCLHLQLTGFTAQHLAQLLVCKLSSNMTYSRETWKLLLTKTSAVLDDALIMVAHVVSNMVMGSFCDEI